MTTYLKIDNKEHIDWLGRIIDNWLNRDPNNATLQANILQIMAWKDYLSKSVSVAQVVKDIDSVEIVGPFISEKDLAKLKAKPIDVVEPKRRGRPPSKETVAKRKQKEKQAAQQEKKLNHLGCPEHPTYGGRNRPSRDCEGCWNLYKKFHPADWKPVYAAFQRNQNKERVARNDNV